MDDKSSLHKKAQFLYERAKRQLREGKYEEAIADYDKAIALAQALGDTHMGKETIKIIFGLRTCPKDQDLLYMLLKDKEENKEGMMMIPVATLRAFANAKITIVIGDVTLTDAKATAPTPLEINIPSTIVYAVITITDTIGGITYCRNSGTILLVPSLLFVDVNCSIVRYTNNFYDYTSF